MSLLCVLTICNTCFISKTWYNYTTGYICLQEAALFLDITTSAYFQDKTVKASITKPLGKFVSKEHYFIIFIWTVMKETRHLSHNSGQQKMQE